MAARLNLGKGLEDFAERFEALAEGLHEQPVANAVAGALFELSVQDASNHVYSGQMLETLDFYAEPGEAGVLIQDYKVFVDGLDMRKGIPRKWRPKLIEAGQEALREAVKGAVR